MNIGYYDGVMSSFTLSIELDQGVTIMKQLVIVTLSIMENISYEDAQDKADILFNNYNGIEAAVLKLNINKYIMNEDPWNDEFGTDTVNLEVVSLDRLNGDDNKSEYVKLTDNEMQAVFNEGMKGYITAKVVYDDTTGDSVYKLLVTENDKEFLIYYDPSTFVGEFEKGSTYTFYGTVAKYLAGYDGYMRLDFFEKGEAVELKEEQAENDEELSYIPGCNAYTIMENMKLQYGVDNPEPRESRSGYVFSRLDGYYQYEIYTYKNLTDVYMVDFSINNNGKDTIVFMEDALEFLFYVATVPYDTADSIVVQEWIEENVGSIEAGTSFEIVVGDAKFVLYGDWYFGVVYLDISLEPFPILDEDEDSTLDNVAEDKQVTDTEEIDSTIISSQNPSFVGSTCLDIDYSTGMPAYEVTEFSGSDSVIVAGCLEGVSGENDITVQWIFPDGYVEETKQYRVKNGETINVGFSAEYIGSGTGSATVILDSTGEVLATYFYTITGAPIYDDYSGDDIVWE